ncbi:MAG: zinc-ribbon domain-containing protein [Lachnospiraceae bacterium]|nr:zinc-ribbon domain-containing protein [Lachnospiraceae bacterium]
MFCENCGKPLLDGATFCTECGCKVGDNTGGDSGKVSVPVPNIPQPGIPAPQAAAPQTATPQTVAPKATASQAQAGKQPVQKAPAPKKKGLHPVVIVLLAIVGTIVLGFIGLVIIGLSVSDSEGSSDTDAERSVTEGSEEAGSKENNPEAIDQLLAILDEMEAATESLGSGMDDATDIKAIIDVGNKWYEQIEDQYKRSQEIEGLPANIKKAAADDYEMYLSAIESFNKDMVFAKDIQELAETIDENDLAKTYNDFEEKHSSTQCPDNMADSWAAIGRSLDFLAESYNRSVQGQELDDSLRIFSSNNHLIRFSSVFGNETSRIVEVNSAEQEFMLEQINKVGEIDSEIREAVALAPEEMEKYEFKYDVDGVVVDPTYSHVENIYPSLYNTYDSFVTVNIGCLHGEKDIIVECEIPGLSQSMSQSYHIGSAMTALSIKPPAASDKPDLNTAKDSQIKLTIKDKKDQSIIDTQSFPVHIYSRNDFVWYSDEFGTVTRDNILCFLAPDADAITELKRNAIDVLEEMSGGEMNALVGYQGPYFAEYDDDGNVTNLGTAQYITTFLQAAAIMRAMSDMGVRYTNDAFSINNADQHILFPDQVIDKKTGLCIETSLVVASALQSMGMHTYIIFPPGHAQVAVETWEGSGRYFLIETTVLPNTNSMFVDDANAILSGWTSEYDDQPIASLMPEQWAQMLLQDPDDDSDDCYVLDCSDGAFLGMTPFAN